MLRGLRRATVEFPQQDRVTVIASDAHDTQSRPPRLTAGLDVAYQAVGAEADSVALKLFLQPHLDERLVGNITSVRGRLD